MPDRQPNSFAVTCAQVVGTLPAVGRILLQTGARDTGRFQQATARALAAQLGAVLLVVDDSLLQAISRASLGGEVRTAVPGCLWFGPVNLMLA